MADTMVSLPRDLALHFIDNARLMIELRFEIDYVQYHTRPSKSSDSHDQSTKHSELAVDIVEWSDVRAQLREEQKLIEQQRSFLLLPPGVSPSTPTPVITALREAATELKINREILQFEVVEYANRCDSRSPTLHTMIKHARFGAVAKRIMMDKWLVMNFLNRGKPDEHLPEEEQPMWNKIHEVQEEWFQYCWADINNLGCWSGMAGYGLTEKGKKHKDRVDAKRRRGFPGLASIIP
ncbi:MAG: hypothetical protein M1823_002047 [Watsoniomyces obsoletus]|nr:MAG: hypothetical protein M1823_002047 [Watsoniomyces obsoletus]